MPAKTCPFLFVAKVCFAGLCLSGSFGFCTGCFGSGCCFSFCLSGSGGSLLFSHFLGDLLVHLLFGFEFLGSSGLLGGSNFVGSLYSLVVLCLLPILELSLSCGLVESALANAATEVLHQHHAFAGKDVANGVSGLCAALYPIKGAFKIQIYCGRVSVGIVRTQFFSKSTITWCASVGDYNAIESIILATVALQSDFSCHLFFLVLIGLNKCAIS